MFITAMVNKCSDGISV